MVGYPHTEGDYLNKRVDFENVKTLEKLHIRMMLNRTQRMFKWSGLPDSLPQKFLEIYLQNNGTCAVAMTDQGLKCFFGGAGNVLNEYYAPSQYVIANPALDFFKSLIIKYPYHDEPFDESTMCVMGVNDTMSQGLYPLIQKYAYQLATNEITLNIADINSRAVNILTATSESAFESIKSFLKDLKKGVIAHIRESMIQDNDVRSLPFSAQTNNGITNLIELQQYYKASFYNEIGLNANYNMKRESIQQNESDMNHDSLMPLIDDMLYNRKILAEQLNECFGLNVSVEFDSIWMQRMRLEEAVLDQEEELADNSEASPEQVSDNSEEIDNESPESETSEEVSDDSQTE